LKWFPLPFLFDEKEEKKPEEGNSSENRPKHPLGALKETARKLFKRMSIESNLSFC